MRVQAPKLMGFGDAIQANQSMSDSFNKLGSISQNFLNYSENQKQNAFDNQYKTDTLNETKNQNVIANKNADRTFYYGVKRDGIKDNQWQQTFNETKNNNSFANAFKNKIFDYQVGQDKISNGFKQQQLNKPDYATFNGVDTQGNPTLSMIDKNTGKVVNTGQQVYSEPKQLAPEQSLYYLDRANEMKQKTLDTLEKNFRATNEFNNLNEQDQLKAIDYIRANGKLPQVSYEKGWGGKGYYLPMSEAEKQNIEQQNQDAKNTLRN